MLLIKAATSEGWWPEDADFIQFIKGRITFELPSWYRSPPEGKKTALTSGFASAVVIFDKDWQGERRPAERLSRDALRSAGQAILQQQAAKAA
jgi:phage N-6-adenine-methyltransferase